MGNCFATAFRQKHMGTLGLVCAFFCIKASGQHEEQMRVWSKYAQKLSDLAKPENIDKAVQCLNELITNALHHVPDVLTFLSLLKDPNHFFCSAIPQVIHVANLAACYSNQQVFKGAVKIRKGEAATLMMKATNMEAVKAIFYCYMEENSLTDGLRVCYKHMEEISQTFTIILPILDEKLRTVVCIFYLVLRALDTVEDDTTLSLERRAFMLKHFHTYLYQPDWKFMDSKDKSKQVLEDFPTISREFRNLEKVYQDVIVDICYKMGHGMAEFLEKEMDSLNDWDKYCHYVGGLVGIGLYQIWELMGLEDQKTDQETELVNSMGVFLQKMNIIRDYKEDQVEEREFWPKEVWSKYAQKLSDLAKPENADKAIQCLNELITNVLHHVPDILTLLSKLKNQSVFSAFATVNVIVIATSAACYNNQHVFSGIVKIRKGEAVTVLMKATNMEAVKAIIYHYMEEIVQKIPSQDPSSSETKQIVSSICSMCKPSSSLVSWTNYLPIYLSCILLSVAFWWQYQSTSSI